MIRSYYQAIAERRYADAYRLWESGGAASGKSLEAFTEGFRSTASVEVALGTPGPIEGAAGSRYVEIPVRITALATDGRRDAFEGEYTLRRSVVDGATPEQRAWRIHSAAIHRGPASQPSVMSDRARYPAHWWTPVPREGAPAWEILPQEAGPGEVILSKRHELGLLSNFAPTPFTFRGHRYASLEGFWQMMLYPEGAHDPRATHPGIEWKHTREEVAAMTSFEAKKAGDLAEANMRTMHIDWASFEGRRFPYRSARPGEHYRLIVAATREKVRQNADVRRVLLSTGDLVLKPDHHQEPDAPPEWRYFEILTEIRAELRRRP